MAQRALPAVLSRDMNTCFYPVPVPLDHYQWLVLHMVDFFLCVFLCAYFDLVSSYFVRFIENSQQKSRCERTRCAPSCR